MSLVTSGMRIAAATCNLTIGTPAATSASRLAPTSSNSTAWWQTSKTTPRWVGSAAAASASSMPASVASRDAAASVNRCSRK